VFYVYIIFLWPVPLQLYSILVYDDWWVIRSMSLLYYILFPFSLNNFHFCDFRFILCCLVYILKSTSWKICQNLYTTNDFTYDLYIYIYIYIKLLKCVLTLNLYLLCYIISLHQLRNFNTRRIYIIHIKIYIWLWGYEDFSWWTSNYRP